MFSFLPFYSRIFIANDCWILAIALLASIYIFFINLCNCVDRFNEIKTLEFLEDNPLFHSILALFLFYSAAFLFSIFIHICEIGLCLFFLCLSRFNTLFNILFIFPPPPLKWPFSILFYYLAAFNVIENFASKFWVS